MKRDGTGEDMKNRMKIAKILMILIIITLITGKLFADSTRDRARVCISNIYSKNDLSSIKGEDHMELLLKGPHAFYSGDALLFEVAEAKKYTVKRDFSGMSLFVDTNGLSNSKPTGFQGVGLYEAGAAKFAISQEVRIVSKESNFVYGGKEYAQDIYFVPANSGFVAVNEIDVEEYLRGVVPSEMPSGWHIEALKSQAVAARTYAYRVMSESSQKPFDLLSNTGDQVYGGVSKYKLETDYAISATAGEILSYEGSPIIAFYSADNGGYTVSNSRFPYLKSKLDLFSGTSDSVKWNYYVDFKTLEKALGLPKITSIVISNLDPSLRVSEIVIETISGERKIRGSELRAALGYTNVKSTLFTMSETSNTSINVLGDLPTTAHSPATNASGAQAGGNVDSKNPSKGSASTQNSQTQNSQTQNSQTQNSQMQNSASQNGENNRVYLITAADMNHLELKNLNVLSVNENKKVADFKDVYVQNISALSKFDAKALGPNTNVDSQITKEKSGVSTPASDHKSLNHSPLIDASKFLASRGDKKILSESGGVYIKGVGYGHGVGLSQWGARNRAMSGHSYKEILEFYYEGAIIENK